MKKTLLTVLAHPDDESFGPGGTLAKYARQGVDVHIAIATDGVAGSVVEEYAERRAELREIRKAELEAAVAVLGGTLHMLNYRDSGYVGDPANQHPEAFINVPLAESTGRVVELIRRYRPQVVMTHDETGGYRHPDHIRCYAITTAAFHAAGDPAEYPELGLEPYQPQRLYYTVLPNRWLKFFTLMIRLQGQDPTKMGRNKDIDFTKLGHPNEAIHARINIRDVWEVKQQASAQHKSQGGGVGFAGRMPKWLQKRIFGWEYFMRAVPPPNGREREQDFFSQIK